MSDPDDHSNDRDMDDQNHEKDGLKEGIPASDLPPIMLVPQSPQSLVWRLIFNQGLGQLQCTVGIQE